METGCSTLKRIRLSWEEEEREDPWEEKDGERERDQKSLSSVLFKHGFILSSLKQKTYPQAQQ